MKIKILLTLMLWERFFW